MYCFVAAYNTNRTLVIDESVLNYYGEEGWSSVFEGVSDTCTSVEGGNVTEWKGLSFFNSTVFIHLSGHVGQSFSAENLWSLKSCEIF